jgi:hypothetical protein
MLSEKSILQEAPLDPYEIKRKGNGKNGKKYFGLGPTQLEVAIKNGEVPAPIPLTDSGRAKGWTGQMIIDHHARRLRLAAAKR